MSPFTHWVWRKISSRNSRERRGTGSTRRRTLIGFEQLESRRVLAAVPTSLAVITAPQSTLAGNVSGSIKVELLDQFGKAIAAPVGGKTITLTSSSPAGVFLATNGVTTITTVTIPKGATTAVIRYEDTKAGMPQLTFGSAGLKIAAQSEIVSALAASQVVFIDQSIPPKPLPAQTLALNTITPVTVELLDAFGHVAKAAATSTVVTVTRVLHGPTRIVTAGKVAGQELALSTDSATGQFFATAAGGTAIAKIVIPTGASTATFFYEDSVAGVDNVFVNSASLGSAQQTENVSAAAPTQIGFVPPGGTAAAPAVTFTVGTVGVVHVQLESMTGAAAVSSAGGTVTLTSSSATGVFSNFVVPAGVVVTGTSGTVTLTIPAGTSFGAFSFNYKDTTPGTVTFTASAVIGGATLVSNSQVDAVVAMPTTIVFLGGSATTAAVGVQSGPITIQLQDQFGNPVVAGPSGIVVMLTSTSATGTFQQPPATNNIMQVLIQPGQSTISFAYTDITASGMTPYIITASGMGVTGNETMVVM